MINDFLELYKTNLSFVNYSSNELKVVITNEVDREKSLQVLEKYFYIEKSFSNIKISLTKTKLEDFYVFYEEDDFINRVFNNWNELTKSTVLILKKEGEYLIKEQAESYSDKNKLIFNVVLYKELIFKLNSNKFFNNIKSIDKEFILVSKSNSVMHIGFLHMEKRLLELDYLKPLIDKLDLRFSKFLVSREVLINEEYIKFFIENISTIGIVKYKKEDRFFKILENLDILISITDRDYDNYINDFSFEKLKSKFKEERNKYFENIDKSLESINKQALSLPLTFGATVFASYQLKDKPLIMFFILVTYGLYTFIAFKSMSIFRYNLKCLSLDVKKEKEELQNTFNRSFQDFKLDFQKIEKKVEYLDNLIYYLKAVFIILFILFISFIFYQTSYKSDNPKMISLPLDKIESIQVSK